MDIVSDLEYIHRSTFLCAIPGLDNFGRDFFENSSGFLLLCAYCVLEFPGKAEQVSSSRGRVRCT